MKKYINLLTGLLLVLSASFFFSCESDLDKITMTPSTKPGEMTVNSDEPYICTEENAGEVAFEFSWTKADFGENIAAVYYLLFDLEGGSFEAPVEITLGSNVNTKKITSDELGNIIRRLKQPIDMATNMEVCIKAKPMVTGSSTTELPELISDSKAKITATLTSFAMPAIHIIGSLFDNYYEPGGDVNFWNITNYKYVMFRDDPLAEDIYVGYCKHASDWAAGKFKLMTDGSLGSYTMIGKKADGILDEEGKGENIEDLQAEGYYTVTVSIAKGTYSIQPYDASSAAEYSKVELIVNGSSTELTQSHYNPHIWIVDDVTLETGDVTFKLDDASWGAETFPYGKATLNGTPVFVNKAGKYFIKYNDLTGHYIFYQRK